MSAWMDEQLKVAFLLYRRYIGMGLHFNAASAYDYPLYRGATNMAYATFVNKPKKDLRNFIQLAHKLNDRDIDVDRFLFANFRYENTFPLNLNSKKGFDIYLDWEKQYGTKEQFTKSISRIIVGYSDRHPNLKFPHTIVDCIVDMLGRIRSDPDHAEAVIWSLSKSHRIAEEVEKIVARNVLLEMELNKVKRIKSFYDWFAII